MEQRVPTTPHDSQGLWRPLHRSGSGNHRHCGGQVTVRARNSRQDELLALIVDEARFAIVLNPLKVAPETIMDLRVLQTIKEGVVVHDALE